MQRALFLLFKRSNKVGEQYLLLTVVTQFFFCIFDSRGDHRRERRAVPHVRCAERREPDVLGVQCLRAAWHWGHGGQAHPDGSERRRRYARPQTHVFLSVCHLEPSLILSARRSGASAIGVAAGDSHTCALLRGGTVSCWGDNGEGQLGTGDTTNRLASTSVNISAGGKIYFPFTFIFGKTCASV